MYGGGTANQGQVAERGPQPGQVVGTPLRVHLRKQPLWHGHHAASTKFYKRGDYIPDLLVAPVLAILLQYLEHAQTMKPPRRESIQHAGLEEPGKEPFGPACRDYFWVLCKLVENLKLTEDTAEVVDIESFAMRLCQGILGRPWHERRQGGNTATADGALIGMLNLMSAVLQHNTV